MLLKELLKLSEARMPSGVTHDVAVEYELEYTTEDGDVDYKTLEITGTVTITADGYDTGDSPEDYEFDLDEITDKDTDEKLSRKDIPAKEWNKIENMAYDKVNRNR